MEDLVSDATGKWLLLLLLLLLMLYESLQRYALLVKRLGMSIIVLRVNLTQCLIVIMSIVLIVFKILY